MCGELSAFFAELMPFCCFCKVRTLCRSALHLSCTLCPKRLTFYLLVPGVQPTLAVQLPHWHPLSLLTDWSDDHISPALDLGALDMVCAFCLHRVQTENPDGFDFGELVPNSNSEKNESSHQAVILGVYTSQPFQSSDRLSRPSLNIYLATWLMLRNSLAAWSTRPFSTPPSSVQSRSIAASTGRCTWPFPSPVRLCFQRNMAGTSRELRWTPATPWWCGA